MNSKTFSEARAADMKVAIKDNSLFLRTEDVPWTPFVMSGVDFKILHIDLAAGRTTGLFRIAAGTQLPVHEHPDPVQGYIVKGVFAYGADAANEYREVRTGDYFYEPVGTVHRPICPEECIQVTILGGPLVGYDEDGAKVITTAADIFALAKANNAVGHLRDV
jgi:2,4'-dihydroxyacetophenone dioxygenase